MAFLLPPLGRGEVGGAPLDLACQRQRRAADLEEVPARLDADVDVDALGAGGLRVALEFVVGKHVTDDHRGAADVVPADSLGGVEVDPQLVGMVEVAPPRRPRVEVDDAEVDRPDDVGGVGGDQLLGGATRREGDGRRLQPLGHFLRHPLLPDRLLHDPVDEALHHGRPPAQVDQRRLGDRQVVLDDVELRPAGLGEVDLARVGEPHLATVDLEHRVLALGHRDEGSSRPPYGEGGRATGVPNASRPARALNGSSSAR